MLTCAVRFALGYYFRFQESDYEIEYEAFSGCTKLTTVSIPAPVLELFPEDTFQIGPASMTALVEFADVGLQRWYYWSPLSHRQGSDVARAVVFTVMLLGLRGANPDVPALPPELWCYILGHTRRHELGRGIERAGLVGYGR